VTGIERYEREVGGRLARLKAQEGWRVTVLMSRSARTHLADWVAKVAESAAVLESPFASRVLTQQAWIPHVARHRRADAGFFASFPPSPLVFALRGGRFRVVRTMHDAVLWSSPETTSLKNTLYFGPLERWGAERYALVHTVSSHARDDILRHVPTLSDRIVVSGGGVSSLPPPAPDALARLGIRVPFLLTVGTLEPRKNLPFLLRVFDRFRQERSDLQLVLAGRFGWGAAEVERIVAELGLANRIVLTNAITDADLAALYQEAQALLFPSLHEGFGLPLVEAMSAGLPVVSADVTSMPEVCGDAALMVPPSDAEQWLAAMRAVTTDSALRKQLAERGRVRAAAFSWDQVAARVAASIVA
jgi:glycosyltransferase involved in cell wall biosynthesis